MANVLAMDLVHNILALKKLRWSDRRVARELGVHRETVARCVRAAALGAVGAGGDSRTGQDAPIGSWAAGEAPAGSSAAAEPAREAPIGSEPATNLPAGSVATSVLPGAGSCREPQVQATSDGGFIALLPPADVDTVDTAAAEDKALLGSNLSAAAAPYGAGGSDMIGAACLIHGDGGKVGQASQCEPYREIILAKLMQSLCAQRIYQDLVSDSGFTGSYYSVRRFVAKLGKASPVPFRRIECPPGQEAQVDFGAGATIIDSAGRRRSHVLRIVLSHSRKGYSEAVFRQKTDDFLAALEDAFWSWGGVPRLIVIDNLRAAVKNADWYDPELNPRILAFCEHYGTVILPTKPYTPRHNDYAS